MVKKEIGQSGFDMRPFFDPIENIAGNDGREPVASAQVGKGGFRNNRLSVDKKDTGSVSAFWIGPQKNGAKQGPVAGAKIGQRGGGAIRIVIQKPTGPKTDLAEERMKPPEIPTTGPGGRIFGGKGVEKLGGEPANLQRRTSRNAPKLEKPAPKEASHHSPSGTPWWRA